MPPRRPSLGSAIAALPDFAIGAVFLATWIAPQWLGPQRIGQLLLVMLLEFIVIHSAGFMGAAAVAHTPRARRILAMLGLGFFYTLFVGAFAAVFGAWWPLAAFWGLTANRMLGVLVGQAESGREMMLVMRGWAGGVACYLFAVFATTLLPVPALGTDPHVIAQAKLPGGGIWIDEPFRVLAAGFLHFTALGLSELWDHRWLGRRTGALASGDSENAV